MHAWSFRLRLTALIILLSLCSPAQAIQKSMVPGNGAETTPAADPLGRETPAGTVFGFLQACQSANYKTAAQYLHLTPARRQTLGHELASQLKALIDTSGANVSLKRISTRPEGEPQEGVPLDQQNLGTLVAGDQEVALTLERVHDASVGKIWLISDETLAKVPELYDQIQAHEIERKLPAWLVEKEFLSLPLWQWFGLLLAIPLSAALAWMLIKLFQVPRLMWLRYKGLPLRQHWSDTSGPLWLLLGTLVNRIVVSFLGIPLLQRHYYSQLTLVVAVAALFWVLWRVTIRAMQHFRNRAINAGRTGTGSLMILGERIFKALIIIGAVITVLGVLGFNLTTALAGLGIGGLAIALAAQKTLENLFGGVSVLGDEVIRVGDTCQFGDRVGSVEDISLRSTRIRTVERTELSIPNGALATMNVENLTRRDKILFKTNFGLRTETSPDQLRYVLAEVRRMLYEHPKVETSSARIRFVGIAASSLDLEIFSYLLTQDMSEFTAIREDLLLRIVDIVSEGGSSFAFPSRTTYITRDPGLDKEKSEAAAQKVQQWRDEKQLPFPDFTPPEISSFRGSIEYPPPDSSLGNGRKLA
jgi:MscS family membrane protein